MDKNIDNLLEELVKSSRKAYISEDEEEPFILIDRSSEDFVFIASSTNETFDVIEIRLNKLASMETRLQDALEDYVSRDAILTIGCGNSMENFYVSSWDMKRGRRLYYGYEKSHYLLLISRIYWCLENWSYTRLPIEQLREFLITGRGESFKLENIPLKDLIEAENKDLEMGERLQSELSVEYCYEHSCIPSDNIW